MANKKVTYIQSDAHAMVGRTGGPTDILSPGERVLFEEDLDSHAEISRAIEAGDPAYAHLKMVDVDLSAEQAAEEERTEMLAKASEIAAEERNKEMREVSERIERQSQADAEAAESGVTTATSETDFPPQDQEAISISEQAGAGQRASTQEDVVEDSTPKSGRRSSRGKG